MQLKRKILLLLGLLISVNSISFAQAADTIKIGCYVISLHDFDFHNEEYTARFWLWMVYKNPDISFKDDVEIPNAKEISTDEYIEDSLGAKKWIQMKLKCKMKETWKTDNFPFDRQEMNIIVENSKYDVRNLVFVADTLGEFYDPQLTVEGWEITSFKVSTDVSHYSTGFGDASLKNPHSEYSKLVINIKMERNGWGLFFKMFMGLYVAFAIAFISFFIDPKESDPRFGLPVGGLFAAVSNKYIIDSYLPDNSALTIIDNLHGITFVFIFLIIAFSVVSMKYEESGLIKQSKKIDLWIAWVLFLVYFIINITLISWALFSY